MTYVIARDQDGETGYYAGYTMPAGDGSRAVWSGYPDFAAKYPTRMEADNVRLQLLKTFGIFARRVEIADRVTTHDRRR